MTSQVSSVTTKERAVPACNSDSWHIRGTAGFEHNGGQMCYISDQHQLCSHACTCTRGRSKMCLWHQTSMTVWWALIILLVSSLVVLVASFEIFMLRKRLAKPATKRVRAAPRKLKLEAGALVLCTLPEAMHVSKKKHL
eukprot:486037-Amphidinium_carterae.1